METDRLISEIASEKRRRAIFNEKIKGAEEKAAEAKIELAKKESSLKELQKRADYPELPAHKRLVTDRMEDFKNDISAYGRFAAENKKTVVEIEATLAELEAKLEGEVEAEVETEVEAENKAEVEAEDKAVDELVAKNKKVKKAKHLFDLAKSEYETATWQYNKSKYDAETRGEERAAKREYEESEWSFNKAKDNLAEVEAKIKAQVKALKAQLNKTRTEAGAEVVAEVVAEVMAEVMAEIDAKAKAEAEAEREISSKWI